MKKRAEYKRYTHSRLGNFTYFFFLILAGAFSMLPFIYCICTAFKPLDELLVFPPRFFVHRPTVENFVILPTLIEKLRVPLSRYIFNTAFITFAGTALHIIVASMAAYVLAKTDIKFKKAIFYY